MKDNVIKKQQMKYMQYHLLAFSIIFVIFGLILYLQLAHSVFQEIDGILQKTKQEILSDPKFVEEQLRFGQMLLKRDRGLGMDFQKQNHVLVHPRVTPILWNENGEIENERSLGRFLYESDLTQLNFQPGAADKIVLVHLDNEFYFRCLAFGTTDEEGRVYSVQLIANVDGEQGILEQFFRLLLICMILFVPLAIIASYILSRKAMKPVVRAWDRQVEFVENASHELRTPLTIIQNKLETMLTVPQAKIIEQSDGIAMSLAETRRLARLTADLMTLARSDSAQTMLEKEPFVLDDMIRLVSEPYAQLAQMQGKALVLQLNFPGKLTADRERIHQLLVILLDNALKYTEEGDSITVDTGCKDHWVLLQVRDTGIGIGEESLGRVFDRFYREDQARFRASGGMGLGLSIAQWIVESHGGTVKVEKNQPKGTVFHIRLPV